MRIKLAKLEHMAQHRPPGYLSDVTAHGTISGDSLELSRLAYHALLAKYGERWPLTPFGLAMRGLKHLRTPEDRGAGDTLARVIGPVRSERYRQWHKDTFGKPCTCIEDHALLNQIYPYEPIPNYEGQV
jgi:hypothetical protein